MDEDLPHNAIIIKDLLQSMGVEKYDPRVVHQLLNFMYGYVSDVLQDADVYNAQDIPARAEIGLADVMQAIHARETLSFVQPPSLDVLMDMADARNKQPLPEIGRRFGLRLPPDEDCLLAPNYRLASPSAEPGSEGAGTARSPTPLSSRRGGEKTASAHSFKFLPREAPGAAPRRPP